MQRNPLVIEAKSNAGAGLLYTGTNSYTPVLWLLVVMSALASVAALRAKPAFQPLPGSV
jgi:hypothetical protein